MRRGREEALVTPGDGTSSSTSSGHVTLDGVEFVLRSLNAPQLSLTLTVLESRRPANFLSVFSQTGEKIQAGDKTEG